MLITQGFGWVSWFSPAWFLLGLALIIFFIVMSVWWQGKKEKKGEKLRDDEIGAWGVAGVATVMTTFMAGLFWLLSGMGPHYDIIERDIETQFNLQHVNHVWIDSEEEYKYTAKDPEGKFVMCNTEETNIEGARELSCDSGQDYWKGLP